MIGPFKTQRRLYAANKREQRLRKRAEHERRVMAEDYDTSVAVAMEANRRAATLEALLRVHAPELLDRALTHEAPLADAHIRVLAAARQWANPYAPRSESSEQLADAIQNLDDLMVGVLPSTEDAAQ